jgi:hypothetical protein
METVDLIASGYEWICPNCDEDNREISINVIGTAIGDVTCQSCGETFDIGNYDHCFSR